MNNSGNYSETHYCVTKNTYDKIVTESKCKRATKEFYDNDRANNNYNRNQYPIYISVHDKDSIKKTEARYYSCEENFNTLLQSEQISKKNEKIQLFHNNKVENNNVTECIYGKTLKNEKKWYHFWKDYHYYITVHEPNSSQSNDG